MRILRFLLIIALFFLALGAEAKTLKEQLLQIKGIVSVEKVQNNAFFKEAYVVMVQEPLDYSHPEQGTFNQRVILSSKSFESPVVFITEGYSADYANTPNYLNELCPILNANQIFVEHRYFSASTPSEPIPWKYLTVENAAADHHHIIQMLKPLYYGKWVSTGISKGGQTTLFHRTLYPNDVDASVPYVAPLNFSDQDKRHEIFIEQKTGTPEARAKVLAFQTEILKRRDQIQPLFDQYCQSHNLNFKLPLDQILDYSVMEYAFSFWQWGTDPKEIPSLTSPTAELFRHFVKISDPSYFSIEGAKSTLSFFVQAKRELGYYAYDTKPFVKYLHIKNSKDYLEKLFIPLSANFAYNSALSHKCDEYIKNEAKNILFIYGEWDPWSASAANIGNNHNVVKYINPQGCHRSRINSLPTQDREEAIATLKKWLDI